MGRPRTTFGLCTVSDCGAAAYSKCLCRKHYNRAWRHGDVSAGDRKTKFTSRIKKTDGCWLWIGALFKSGYGKFSDGEKKYRAHRVAYETFTGPIPTGMQVLHRCDNPPCVNPDHLFLGTHLDNMRDMEAKGRAKWIKENLQRRAA